MTIDDLCTDDEPPKPRRFYIARDRKKLAGTLEQRFSPGRRLMAVPGRPGEYMTRRWRWITTKRRKPKRGGHWATYLRIRDSATGKTVVNLGRVGTIDPDEPEVVRVLLEHGLFPDDLRDAIRRRRRVRQPRLDARLGRARSRFCRLFIDQGRAGRVRPRGAGPSFGMRGTVRSRFDRGK